MKENTFALLITYSFSTDYVSDPCGTEEEGIAKLKEYLEKEKEIIREEFGYTPVVRENDDTEVELFYTDDPDLISAHTDRAVYKVIEICHCGGKKKDDVKTWIVGVGGSETDGVDMTVFTGTKHEAKKHLAKAVRDARDENREEFDYGYTSIGDIEERADGSLYACACFSGYHLDFQAYPEDDIPEAYA